MSHGRQLKTRRPKIASLSGKALMKPDFRAAGDTPYLLSAAAI
jgi:hypothetical protein